MYRILHNKQQEGNFEKWISADLTDSEWVECLSVERKQTWNWDG